MEKGYALGLQQSVIQKTEHVTSKILHFIEDWRPLIEVALSAKSDFETNSREMLHVA